MLSEILQGNFLLIIGLIVAITVHEAAHAFVSDRLGDPTARLAGRLTLNPLKHLDPLGTLFMLLVGFGWGKPVPFDSFNLREPKKDTALISLAGPASNILLAAILAILIRLLLLTNMSFASILGASLLPIIIVNLGLAVFNLLPISPLDGFKIVGGILPDDLSRNWYELERVGYLFLLMIVFLIPGFLGSTVIPIVNFLYHLLL